ncbi:MAG TPA: hypothetical protein VMB02_00095 [Candidatus Aquilonibacter sp.]|nr:hypothetical protein [Candidatus Aquilonibacter sp.]
MRLTAKCAAILFGASLLALAVASRAAEPSSIPAGTILPVSLNSTLSSARAKIGQTIIARVTQDVPLSNGQKIKAGATVVGHVTAATPAAHGNPARLSVRFDTLKLSHERIPIATNLRAVASFMAVEEAQIPDMGPDRGTPEDAWTTTQIGGDAVYRGGGPVMDKAFGRVGEPVYGGVLDHLNANADRGCRGAVDSNGAAQALWVFSSDACGAYSLPNLKIVHSGRTDPMGEISWESSRGQVEIHAGAGMLLRVDTSSSQ